MIEMMRIPLILVWLFLFPRVAQAFFQYAPNFGLREEVEGHEYRILPRSDSYALALDGDFFKPVFVGAGDADYYREDFYHGNGYWLDFRGEFQALDRIVLNLRTTLTQGTTSNGPTFNALVIPRLGLTYRQNGFLGFEWETRLGDIDRQTLGAGIFIELKETGGGYISARDDEFKARILVDGTGSFSLDGGVVALELMYGDGLIGGTLMMLERDVGYRPPQFTGTLFTKASILEDLTYRAELAGNERNLAVLAGLDYGPTFDRLKIHLAPQYRHYGRKVFGDLAGAINQTYVGYDQNDKPFTNALNVFAYGDNVDVFSSQLGAEYRFNRFYAIYARSEWFAFQFRERSDVSGVFYRAGFRFFPFPGREDEFGLLIGNQYLIATTLGDGGRMISPPNQADLENKPLFMQQTFWMVHFSIKM
ncbi:MAG: hypothetical protein KGP28_06235 [Bdellovibrionales bacterium]|nr:hypothetical protein [Bdellovibrionales bacterium]